MALEKPQTIKSSHYRSAKWDELTEGRAFTQADVPLLALLCQWYEVSDTALSELDVGGEIQTAYSTETGELKAMPQLSTLKMASAEIRALNKQLGIKDAQEKPKLGLVVTPFERIAKSYAGNAQRKPNTAHSHSA